jgi:hypothetical protein
MVDWNARLREAVRAGDARRVVESLARGASVNGASGASTSASVTGGLNGDDAATPLHAAAEGDNADVVRALLDAGADVNARDAFGNTPLRNAAAAGTLAVVKLLVAAGADPLIPGRMTLNAVDRARERKTPEGRMITVFFERWLAEGRRPAPVRPPTTLKKPVRSRNGRRR